jgi:hypothetical protein
MVTSVQWSKDVVKAGHTFAKVRAVVSAMARPMANDPPFAAHGLTQLMPRGPAKIELSEPCDQRTANERSIDSAVILECRYEVVRVTEWLPRSPVDRVL